MKKILNEIISDRRGTNVFTTIKRHKAMVSYTKKGYYRGGDYHNCDQLFYVIKGRVKYWIKIKGKEKVMILKEGDMYIAKASNPHLIKALMDVVFLEVFLGKDTNTFYYEEYRKRVLK